MSSKQRQETTMENIQIDIEEQREENILRPICFNDYVGQKKSH